jgi:Bacterial PH domain
MPKPSVIVWDLETVPDLAGFAAANDLAGKSDAEVREAIGDQSVDYRNRGENLRVHLQARVHQQTSGGDEYKIESVTVTQSILGRILGYGTIHIRGTGEQIACNAIIAR